MTMTEVSDKLIAQGFQLDVRWKGKIIFLNGELVGWLNDTYLSLRSDMPSSVNTALATTIFFSDIHLEERIRRQYRMLITSARRYDRYIRKKRVNKIRQYFETIKTKDKLSADLDSVSDIVDSVTVALEEL